jgi:hypothetical protein
LLAIGLVVLTLPEAQAISSTGTKTTTAIFTNFFIMLFGSIT